VPVWVDEGSGCHLDMTRYGLRREPTVQEILATGADAVLFSGDKLLGGPQSGVLLGTDSTITPLRRHPLRRALRPDKSTLVSLAATLDAYLSERPEAVPLYRLLSLPESSLRVRAKRLARRLRQVGLPSEAVATRALLGGGTTPDQTLPSWGIALAGGDAAAAGARRATPPVVGRVEGDRLILDLRAVLPEQDRHLFAGIATLRSR
jgi:L-seryl-tRNA(Ser) seleniumtransferase